MIDLEKFIIKKNALFFEVYFRLKNTAPYNILLVIDDNEMLIGIIAIKEMHDAEKNSCFELLTAYDIANKDYAYITNHGNYREKALELFYENNYNNLPVITEQGYVTELLNRSDFYELRVSTYALGSGEDIIFMFVLRDAGKLFYIDVGAFDPHYGSITKFFYDRGSHGINIEPLTRQYQMLTQDRPRDININALCADVDGGVFEVYMNNGGSTAVLEYAVPNSIAMPIKSVTLKSVMEKFVPIGQTIHFMKVDVEGFEKQVLSGMDFTCFRPWIIMCESTIPNTDLPTHDDWESILLSNGYSFAQQYGVNRFYVESKVKDLLMPRFIPLETMYRRLLVTEVNTSYKVL